MCITLYVDKYLPCNCNRVLAVSMGKVTASATQLAMPPKKNGLRSVPTEDDDDAPPDPARSAPVEDVEVMTSHPKWPQVKVVVLQFTAAAIEHLSNCGFVWVHTFTTRNYLVIFYGCGSTSPANSLSSLSLTLQCAVVWLASSQLPLPWKQPLRKAKTEPFTVV